MKDNKQYYIISKMFSGSYLEDGNIGHEIVNFFLDDAGDNYIYITKSGIINAECDDKVKAVVLTRYRSEGCLEVLGVSEVEEQLVKKSEKKPLDVQIDDYIVEARKKNPKALFYDGKDYQDIFHKNKWWNKSGELKEQEEAHYLTFKTKRFLYPKGTILIYGQDYKGKVENDNLHLKDKNFGKITPILYIDDKSRPKSFDKITELIADKNLWVSSKKRAYPWQINEETKSSLLKNDLTWLHIMGKENDELVFSNMLRYFLDLDNGMKKRFFKKVLGIEDPGISESAEIQREYKNIDLYIRDDENKHFVVIENKIKSGINGVSDKHSYKNIASQLSKYHRIVKAENKNNYQTHFYIFVPDYRKNDVNEKTIKQFEFGKDYKIIYYSEIYNFFKNENYDGEEKDRFKEFIKMLEIHSTDYYNDAYIEMQRRFLNTIEDIK